MILKIKERYQYTELKDNLQTYIFEFDSIKYKRINLISNICELKNMDYFMKLFEEKGSPKNKMIKAALCLNHFDIERKLDNENYTINDYETYSDATNVGYDAYMLNVFDIELKNNGNIVNLLIDCRRNDVEVFNNNNIRLGNLGGF